jgi:hypothetical protein
MAVLLQAIFTNCTIVDCACQSFKRREDEKDDTNLLCTCLCCDHHKGSHQQAMLNTATTTLVAAAVITPASLDSTITTPSSLGVVIVPGIPASANVSNVNSSNFNNRMSSVIRHLEEEEAEEEAEEEQAEEEAEEEQEEEEADGEALHGYGGENESQAQIDGHEQIVLRDYGGKNESQAQKDARNHH